MCLARPDSSTPQLRKARKAGIGKLPFRLKIFPPVQVEVRKLPMASSRRWRRGTTRSLKLINETLSIVDEIPLHSATFLSGTYRNTALTY